MTSTVSAVLINAYATHTNPPELRFPHELNARRNWRDPALAPHLHGLRGFLYKRITDAVGPGAQLTPQERAIDEHIQRVRNHLSFHVDETHMAEVSTWAMAANALLFLEDTTLRDPMGRVLSGPGADPDAEVPQLTHGRVRKQANIAALQARGVPTLDWLPHLAPDPEVILRSRAEIADRISSLTAVATRADSLQAGNETTSDVLRTRLPHAFVAMTPAERSFLANAAPDQQTLINFGWRFECLPVLLWAIDYHEAPLYPTAVCDVARVTGTVLNTSYDDLVQGDVRDVAAILDQADFLYRLHWAVVNARVSDTEAPVDVLESIVVERRHALEWLIDVDTAWDDIELST